MASLIRRAGEYISEKARPIAEKVRLPDLTKVRTVAAYGVALPVVMGKHRVPGVVVARSATHALYALCEAPAAGVRRIFRSDKGTALPDLSGWVILPGGPTQEMPSGYGFQAALDLRGTVCVIGPLEDGRPLDCSFEVATRSEDESATRLEVFAAGEGSSPANWTSAEMRSLIEDGTNGWQSWYTDGPWIENRYATDMDVRTHVEGGVNVHDAVWWNRATMTIWWSRRIGSGAWSTPVAIHGSYAPQTGARPQVKVDADATAIHVVWSRSSQDLSSVEIVHASSANGGTSWSYDTVTRSARSAANLGKGVHHLSLSFLSGTVWVAYCQWRTPREKTPIEGASAGIIVACKSGASAWAYPPVQSAALIGASQELSILHPVAFTATTSYARLFGVSIAALTATTAQVAFSYYTTGSADIIQVLSAPVALSAGAVQWGSTAGHHASFPGGGVLDSSWVAANLRPQSITLSRVHWGSPNFGATRIIRLGSGKCAVAWESPISTTPVYNRILTRWMVATLDAGVWSAAWTAPIEIASGETRQTRDVSMYWDGTSLVVAVGQSYPIEGAWSGAPSAPADPLAFDRIRQYKGATPAELALVLEYRPETVDGNDLITRCVTGPEGTVFTVESTNFDGDAPWETAIVQATRQASQDDVLPGTMIRTLLTDRTRGARISLSLLDSASWARFDDYCTAMGIWFSLSLVEQSAAWAMAVEIAESANAIVYWSAGTLKVCPRETATITANGATFTPLPEHSASCATIRPEHLRTRIKVTRTPLADRKNVVPVTYRDRSRNYQDVTTEYQDEASVQTIGQRKAQPLAAPWITRANVAAICGTLRLRRTVRSLNTYTLDAPQAYMLLEVCDLVTISDPDNGLSPRVVRITRIEESGSWITITAEDALSAAASEQIPDPVVPPPFPTLVAPPVNAPIVFAAAATLTGSTPEVWSLLSWPDGASGVRVQASLDDGQTWSELGTCTTESPTGWLLAAADNLTPRGDLVPHYGLVPGAFDRLTSVDLSESGLAFPAPVGTQWMDMAPGALVWIDGELIAYRRLTGGLPDQLIHGCHGTAAALHPLPARIGAVTSAAFRWAPPTGSGGAPALLRFSTLGAPPYQDQAASAGTTISITIPAGV